MLILDEGNDCIVIYCHEKIFDEVMAFYLIVSHVLKKDHIFETIYQTTQTVASHSWLIIDQNIVVAVAFLLHTPLPHIQLWRWILWNYGSGHIKDKTIPRTQILGEGRGPLFYIFVSKYKHVMYIYWLTFASKTFDCFAFFGTFRKNLCLWRWLSLKIIIIQFSVWYTKLLHIFHSYCVRPTQFFPKHL